MKYAFEFTATARRQLRGIDQPTALRLLHALSLLGDDPYREHPDVRKFTGHEALHRLRVGACRIAYTVDNGKLIILVVQVGYRREIYRRV
ncbi:type II toxin-antitoxin system RelE/ParE family toxin [Streptomyces sp. NPDC048603]|uniref:type II toxin-antitoxin system RelE family toxin n=1 Tax=Streptomyces sp. NPDC048603 TaxID=3365577 RepID=UPI0037248952